MLIDCWFLFRSLVVDITKNRTVCNAISTAVDFALNYVALGASTVSPRDHQIHTRRTAMTVARYCPNQLPADFLRHILRR